MQLAYMKRYVFFGILLTWSYVLQAQAPLSIPVSDVIGYRTSSPLYIVNGISYRADTLLTSRNANDDLVLVLKHGGASISIKYNDITNLHLVKAGPKHISSDPADTCVFLVTTKSFRRRKKNHTATITVTEKPDSVASIPRRGIVCAPSKIRYTPLLYILDGVHKPTHWYRKNPLRGLDAGKVRSVVVLRPGAGVTSTYGRRAANGVIILTTKDPWTRN